MGVLQRIIFSHTPDEAMSGGLAKACVPGKNCSVPEKIEFLKEIFDLQKGLTTHTFSPYKNFFLNQIVNIFTFTSSIISIITITLVIYLFCKHKHIRKIVASLILHKAREVEAKSSTKLDNSESITLAYIGIALTLLSMAIVILLHYRKSKFCRGYKFSNVVKIVLFISDVQHYIPINFAKHQEALTYSKLKAH